MSYRISFLKRVGFIVRRGCEVIFSILLQVFSNKNYILFASGFGKFSGNAKRLYLELLDAKGMSRCVYWVYSTQQEYYALCDYGVENNSVRKFSMRWAILYLNARAVFFSHDIVDIAPLRLRWIKEFNVWHGRPIKKIGYDSLVERKWIDAKRKNNVSIPFESWDYVFAYDKEHVDILLSAWKVNPKRIIKASPLSINKVKMSCEVTKLKMLLTGKKVVLYAPTFREYSYQAMVGADSINEWLQSNNAYLLIRMHPSRSVEVFERLSGSSRILNVSHIQDVDELIPVTDLLVSDYSSIIFDFYKESKSVVFVWDDFDKYVSTSDLYVNQDSINSGAIFNSWSELLAEPIESLIERSVSSYNNLQLFPELDVQAVVDRIYSDI